MREGSIQQGARQGGSFGRVPLQEGYCLVEKPKCIASPPRPHQEQAALAEQETPVIRGDQSLGAVEEAQPVLGPALLGFPSRQDDDHPEGQPAMRLGQLRRVGLLRVLHPAQLPKSGAGVAGTDSGAASVTFPQGAVACLAGPALDLGQRTVGAAGAPLGAEHSAGASG